MEQMPNQAAGRLPPKAIEAMSATLYDSPGPILSGTAVLCVASALVAHRTQADVVQAGFILLCVIGLMRIGLLAAYVRSPVPSRTGARMAAWRHAYAIGILACSGTVGLLSMACLLTQSDPTSHMILVATAVGYGSSVAGRNAACLEVSLPQLWAALLPTAVGLLLHGEVSYGLLGAIVLVFGVGMTQIGLSINRSISSAHRSAHELERLAHHDPLTGLLNRAAASDALDALLRTEEPTSVLLIDLDRFKGVNDAFGHGVGDRLLQAVSERLGRNLPDAARAARLGGDEFAVILPAGAADAAGLAAALAGVLGAAYSVEGRELSVGASIGTA
jgi:diguanylate cyclase (GGDEF)-like protein